MNSVVVLCCAIRSLTTILEYKLTLYIVHEQHFMKYVLY